jgi:hypothetical protein
MPLLVMVDAQATQVIRVERSAAILQLHDVVDGLSRGDPAQGEA